MELHWGHKCLTDVSLKEKAEEIHRSDGGTRVTALYLVENDLVDPWETIIVLFPNLERLSVHGNRIHTVPPDICRLTKLRFLWLGKNCISSPFPSTMRRLQYLVGIDTQRAGPAVHHWSVSFYSQPQTQAFLREIAIAALRPFVRRAARTWMLVSRRICSPMGRDVWRRIGQLILASESDEIWEFAFILF